jgi:hypothetical protein
LSRFLLGHKKGANRVAAPLNSIPVPFPFLFSPFLQKLNQRPKFQNGQALNLAQRIPGGLRNKKAKAGKIGFYFVGYAGYNPLL